MFAIMILTLFIDPTLPVLNDMLTVNYLVIWASNALVLNAILNPAIAVAGQVAAWGATVKGVVEVTFGLATVAVVRPKGLHNIVSLWLKTSSKV
jgi:hypothetical protein